MPQSCPSCRAPISPSDAFCPNCGHLLQTPSSQHGERETQPYQPAQRPRPAQSRTRQGTQPQLQPTPQTPEPRPRYSRPWYQKKRFTFPLVFLALLLAIGGAATWYINGRLSSFNDITSPGSDTVPGQILGSIEDGRGAELGLIDPVASPGVTVLMMGVDARDGEAIDIGVRPDSLSVLHISGNGTCRTLSIPRDTRAPLPGYGQSKVNHALSVGGIDYQVLAVEQLLGIEIDHFALIDFDGLAGIIDSMGGITVVNEQEFSFEGVSVPAGQPTLNGEQALVYARFRGDAEGDYGRQRRQQEIIRAVMQQASASDAVRVIPSALGDLEGHLKTDLKTGSIVSLGTRFMRNCDSGAMENATLEGSIGSDWDDLEGMELSFVHVGEGEIASKVDWLVNGQASWQAPHIIALEDHRRGRAT